MMLSHFSIKLISDPNTFGINVGCIDEIEPNKLFKLKTFFNDGQNHIKDRK